MNKTSEKESKLLDSPVQILSQFLHLVTEANDTLLLFFFPVFLQWLWKDKNYFYYTCERFMSYVPDM